MLDVRKGQRIILTPCPYDPTRNTTHNLIILTPCPYDPTRLGVRLLDVRKGQRMRAVRTHEPVGRSYCQRRVLRLRWRRVPYLPRHQYRDHGPSITHYNDSILVLAPCHTRGNIYSRPTSAATALAPGTTMARQSESTPSLPFFQNGLQAKSEFCLQVKSGFEMCFDIGSQHLGCWGQLTFRILSKEVYATLYLQAPDTRPVCSAPDARECPKPTP